MFREARCHIVMVLHKYSPVSPRLGITGIGTIAFVLGLLFPSQGAAQGVAYSIVPSIEEVRWDDAWGLERARMRGARVGLDFGPFVSLQPFYFERGNVRARDDYERPGGNDLPESWKVSGYGADLQFNLLPGDFVPFVRGGGGILRFDPDEGERDERVFLRAGGGLAFGLGSRASAELYAERWASRLSGPYLPGAVPADDFPDDGILSSLVLGAGIRLPLGGDTSAWSRGGGAFLPGIFVEPFAGRLDFDEENLDRQHLAGLRAGLDVNPNVGLRAFYWEGVDRDFSEREEIHGYGAEAQFTLNTGPGLSPFIVAGAGRLRFGDDFLDLEGEPGIDRDHLLLGGGLAIGMSDRTRIELGARNLLMTTGATELEDISAPDQLRSNWLYTAGISISFGAQARTARERELLRQRELDRERSATEEERFDRLDRELSELRDENARLRAGIVAERPVETDEREVRRPRRDGREIREIRDARGMRGVREGVDPRTRGRVLMVPVPEVGEIILRYGEAYAVRAPEEVAGIEEVELARIERAVYEALRAQGIEVADTAAVETNIRIAELERRIPDIVRGSVRAELEAMGIDRAAPARVDLPAPVEAGIDDVATEAPVSADPSRSLLRVEPLSGVQVTSPSQILAGVRVDLGRISESVPLDLVPELAFGIGERDPTLMLAMNARYRLRTLSSGRNIHPFVLGGVALTNRDFLRLNLGYGLEFDVNRRPATGQATRLFVEHQGLGLFDDHRFLVGVALPMRRR